MKVLDYINKKSADNTISIISKKSIAVLSSDNYIAEQAKEIANRSANNGQPANANNSGNGKKNKNRKGKNNNPNTIFYGKVQYLIKNKRMMSWISEIEILDETVFPSDTIKLKKEYTIPEFEQIEI